MKILVIDDEAFVVDFLEEFLLSRGYEVETASNGEEGLERFETVSPRVVLLDIRMPGMSGLDVLRKMREKDAGVGIVMISAFGGEETKGEALRLGANAYLEKPMQLHDLMKVLQLWDQGKVGNGGPRG